MPNNAISHEYDRRIALELLYKQVARRLSKRRGVLLLRRYRWRNEASRVDVTSPSLGSWRA